MVTVNNTTDSYAGCGEQGDFFKQEAFVEGVYLKPKITVFGVGGAGGNAVNNMIRSNLEGVDFVVANTDSQALLQSLCERRIQLGLEITGGLGAGARPDVGRAAAEEVLEDIISYVKNSNMVFITAGMGGGTGTGAAPVIARIAKEHGVLTIGVITKPFHFEGTTRMRTAEKGIDELQQYVDTLIVIPNQNLFRVANERTTFADAFKMADDVLRSGVQGVTDLMVMPGLINLDFADIKTVMSEMGKAMMGTGDAEGERRALEAAEAAISNPLLDDVSMKGARGILINITGGYDMTLYEVDEAANRIREEVDPEANIIFGSTFNEKMNGRMRVSVVATGIDAVAVKQKKQAYEEMAAVRQQSEPFDAVATAENTQSDDKSAQPFSVVKNSEERDVQAAPRKRSPSLFERLTGMKKNFSSDKKDDFPAQQTRPRGNSQEEDLEIPAFLRKSS
jgi:cell division protein FtsZ